MNLYEKYIATVKTIQSNKKKCQCKLKGNVEGMNVTIGEVFDFIKWNNPDNKKDEFLLLLNNMPLVSISKRKFEKYFSF